jgi:hypothetical protein
MLEQMTSTLLLWRRSKRLKATGLEDVVVHFAVSPAKAWDNVHCAMVLPFRSADLVERWCERHALPQGKVIPLALVARLATFMVWIACETRLAQVDRLKP